MAPPKVLLGQNRQNSTATLRKGITTRSQNSLNSVLKPFNNRETRTKRKAEVSPPKEKTNKRHAFANITNVCMVLYFIGIYIIFFLILLSIILFFLCEFDRPLLHRWEGNIIQRKRWLLKPNQLKVTLR